MKLNLEKVWVTSDTHYNHTNICKGITRWKTETPEQLEAVRDFETLEEMNTALVNGINSCVSKNDTLLHLGDWSFGGFDSVIEFREMINCENIIFLIGNHDHHIERNKNNVQKIFTNVSHYLEVDAGKKKFVFCHYPILSWNGMHRGSFMIHGHQHLKGEKRFGEGRRMDAGICGSENYTPYNLLDIVSTLDTKK